MEVVSLSGGRDHHQARSLLCCCSEQSLIKLVSLVLCYGLLLMGRLRALFPKPWMMLNESGLLSHEGKQHQTARKKNLPIYSLYEHAVPQLCTS